MKSMRAFVIAASLVLATAGIAMGGPAGSHHSQSGRSAHLSARHDAERKSAGKHGKDSAREKEGRETGQEPRSGDRLTGLDNAIAHVRANLQDHPNAGLRNALDHLTANQQRHEERARSKGKDQRKARGKH